MSQNVALMNLDNKFSFEILHAILRISPALKTLVTVFLTRPAAALLLLVITSSVIRAVTLAAISKTAESGTLFKAFSKDFLKVQFVAS